MYYMNLNYISPEFSFGTFSNSIVETFHHAVTNVTDQPKLRIDNKSGHVEDHFLVYRAFIEQLKICKRVIYLISR